MTPSERPSLQPLQLRHRTLGGRITFGAHTTNMSEAGLPGARHLGYYLERARGGAAMIVVEPVPVHRTAVLTRGNFRVADDAVIEGFRAITEACHEHGTVMIQQLYHVGQHGDFDNSFQPSWSPSGLPSYHDAEGSHAMTVAEIDEIVAGFVDAARRAQRCGFDGVEIFAAYHSIVDQFWLEWSNRRSDDYGGSFERRMRFSERIMTEIREAVGEDFIIGLAVSVDGSAVAALTLEELCRIVAWHDEHRLMDYVTCGTGSYFRSSAIIPTFQNPDRLGEPLAAALRSVVRHAKVQAESLIRTAAAADELIAAGSADLVSIVRGQIADPALVAKARAGRDEDVRTCISCNQMCWGRRYRDYWISCLVNPSSGREFDWGGDRHEPAERTRRVLVVGGGPAGLEAARVAAERGHSVTLVESAEVLGGQFRLAGRQPRRGQILELLEWYERQLRRLGVEVVTGRRVGVDDVAAFAPEVVVVATGSVPSGLGFQRPLAHVDRLPGVDLPGVRTVQEVLDAAEVSGPVVVLDDLGDWRGGGTAWFLAEQGHQVTMVTPLPAVGLAVARTGGDGELRANLARLGVRWHTESVVDRWTSQGASVRSLLDGSVHEVPGRTLVLATTGDALDELSAGLRAKGVEVHTVGDAVAARLAVHAIYEGRVAARAL